VITKTNKQAALNLISKAIVRLEGEKFIQFNMTGIDWLFDTNNGNMGTTITTDKLRGQFYIEVYSPISGKGRKESYNVTRPTMQAIDELLSNKQEEYLLVRD
jgi:hypothetical protein